VLEQLRSFPLFELFSDDQLAWVAEHGRVVEVPEGTRLFAAGDVPTAFWVLLEGELQILAPMGNRTVPVGSSSTPGVWAGVVPYVFEESRIGARLVQDSRLFEIPSADVRHMVDVGFPIAKHLMLGVTTGTQQWQEQLAERERMLALGRLSAGLAHELNNPASATRRAADQLRTALAAHEASTLDVACAAPGPQLASRLAAVRAEVAAALDRPAVLSPLERSDCEDAMSDWLVGAGLAEGHEVAPTLVDAGLTTADLDRLVPAPDGPVRVSLLRWLVASTETASLIREVELATTRISDLVAAVKAYSYMDRAEVGAVDVRKGIDDTLRVLRAKLEGIAVERDYDRALPMITAHGGELNQVWTNLIDNAADALHGAGTIRVGAHADGDRVVVTVEDDGPGIPDEAVHRVFEPFFTTKGVGAGTGLGLDIARRIVVDTSGGELSVESRPGRTVFRVSLPLVAPP
jgi:signal transduction histidine kinase